MSRLDDLLDQHERAAICRDRGYPDGGDGVWAEPEALQAAYDRTRRALLNHINILIRGAPAP